VSDLFSGSIRQIFFVRGRKRFWLHCFWLDFTKMAKAKNMIETSIGLFVFKLLHLLGCASLPPGTLRKPVPSSGFKLSGTRLKADNRG